MFITRNEKLMSIARELDEERRAGNVRGPFHGIPIVIKDQWQVGPDCGMPTTAGMSALLEARNGDSALLVKKVVFLSCVAVAGLMDEVLICGSWKKRMILLGKTNMSVSSSSPICPSKVTGPGIQRQKVGPPVSLSFLISIPSSFHFSSLRPVN